MNKSRPSLILVEVIDQLKQLRLEKGLSHEALAKKSGVTRSAISHIESGNRRPSLLVALKIAGALGVNLSALLRGIERSVDRES